MLVFFALMLPFMYLIVPSITQSSGVFVSSTLKGYPAYNSLVVGSQGTILERVRIENISSFEVAAKNDLPNATVSIVTSNGSYTLKAIAENSTRGIVGVQVYQQQVIEKGAYATRCISCIRCSRSRSLLTSS